tara:strand:- start:225 stop:503 length:279 start_codon:yes stop_codon:yes gene_type:complete
LAVGGVMMMASITPCTSGLALDFIVHGPSTLRMRPESAMGMWRGCPALDFMVTVPCAPHPIRWLCIMIVGSPPPPLPLPSASFVAGKTDPSQ